MSEKKLRTGQLPVFYLLWIVSAILSILDWFALRSAVTAIPSSSMSPTTSAAPNLLARGTTRSKRESPSSRLIELRIAFP